MNPMMGEDLARIRHRDDIGRAQRARLAHTATVARRRPVAKASSRGGRATFRQWYPRAPGRTLATAAAFEAAAAFAWFGWGQAAPGAVISIILGVGSGVALLISVAAATVVHRLRTDPSPLKGSTAVRRFALTVGIEFGVAGIGAAALGAAGLGDLVAAWVCLVIGIHFVPLGQMVPGLGLGPEAAALSIVGLVAFAAAGTAISPSTVTGLGAGAYLLGHGASMLLAARRRHSGTADYPTRALKVLFAQSDPVKPG